MVAHLLFDAPERGVGWGFPLDHPDAILWLVCPIGVLLLIWVSWCIARHIEMDSISDTFHARRAAGAERHIWLSILLGAVVCLVGLAGLSATARAKPALTYFSQGIAPGYIPGQITAGVDDNVWFTERAPTLLGEGRVAKISPAGTITEFAGSFPDLGGIAAAPDGNIWVVFGMEDPSHGGIGQISPAGEVATQPVTKTSRPTGEIVSGPDGNLWLTGQSTVPGDPGYFIARLRSTPLFSTNPFRGPSGDIEADSLASGPDGNVWFTEGPTGYGSSKIGHIDPSGSIVRVASFSTVVLGQLAAGAGGYLWFTESTPRGPRIARITTAGEVTEFSKGLTGFPQDIAGRSDGSAWFTEASADGGGGVGRILPNGRIAEFCLPGASSAGEIASTPDGSLWLTATTGAKHGARRAIAKISFAGGGKPLKPKCGH
jgi:streptogramin lyase